MTGKREEQIILYMCVWGTETHAQVSTVIYHLPNSHFTALDQSSFSYCNQHPHISIYASSLQEQKKLWPEKCSHEVFLLRAELLVSADNALSRSWAQQHQIQGEGQWCLPETTAITTDYRYIMHTHKYVCIRYPYEMIFKYFWPRAVHLRKSRDKCTLRSGTKALTP